MSAVHFIRMEQNDVTLLESDSWFGALTVDRRRQILQHLSFHTLARGAYVYRLGDAPNGLHVLLDGEVRMVSYSSSGLEMVAMVVRPGMWFGELSVVDGRPRPHNAIVTTSARVARLPMAAVTALTNADPRLWRDIALLGCAHQRWAMRHSERVRTQAAIVRLAGFLLGKATQVRDSTVRMTQEELAEIVGVSRQRANKLLRELAQLNLVQPAYGGVTVHDIGALRAFLNSYR